MSQRVHRRTVALVTINGYYRTVVPALPGGGRVQFAYPAGLERIEAILLRGSIFGDVKRGSGRRCTHEALLDRHEIEVRVTLRVRVDSVICHPCQIGEEVFVMVSLGAICGLGWPSR